VSPTQVAIFCADVGSAARMRFGWAGRLSAGEQLHGTEIEDLCEHVARCLNSRERVALGFECPLFIPLASEPKRLTRARIGEGNRPWSAGAGCGALVTGLAQATFVLARIRAAVPSETPVSLKWPEFIGRPSGLLLWEAFVSRHAKAETHSGDAEAAVRAFGAALPQPEAANMIKEEKALSLIGAALLRAGWPLPATILEQPCLVIAG